MTKRPYAQLRDGHLFRDLTIDDVRALFAPFREAHTRLSKAFRPLERATAKAEEQWRYDPDLKHKLEALLIEVTTPRDNLERLIDLLHFEGQGGDNAAFALLDRLDGLLSEVDGANQSLADIAAHPDMK